MTDDKRPITPDDKIAIRGFARLSRGRAATRLHRSLHRNPPRRRRPQRRLTAACWSPRRRRLPVGSRAARAASAVAAAEPARRLCVRPATARSIPRRADLRRFAAGADLRRARAPGAAAAGAPAGRSRPLRHRRDGRRSADTIFDSGFGWFGRIVGDPGPSWPESAAARAERAAGLDVAHHPDRGPADAGVQRALDLDLGVDLAAAVGAAKPCASSPVNGPGA